MHSPDEVALVLKLREAGQSATLISRSTGISRGTVRDWIAGKTPRRWANGGEACDVCGHRRHAFEALPNEYAYLLGVYLGDGCISKAPRNVFRLRIVLDSRYPGIIDECEQAIRAVMPTNKVGRMWKGGGFLPERTRSSVEIYSYSKAWPCLFPQHGPGRKHERRIELVEWQDAIVERRPDLMLRGLIHSDGCRFMNTGRAWKHPRYVFSNRSVDIRQIFRSTCDAFEVHWTDAGESIYVSRVADVARLDEAVGPKE